MAMLSGFVSDVRLVCRGLRASRVFTLVAVSSLAIGIGANAAIFSVIRTLLLDELAVPAPRELSLVYWHLPGDIRISQMNSSGGTDPATGASLRSNVTYPLSRRLIDAAPPGVAAFGYNFLRDVTVAFDDRIATLVGGLVADEGYFRVLSPRMHLGRPILPDDERDDAPPVAVLSYPLFLRLFGGDQSALGRTVRVNGVTAHIIGVTAPEFRGLSKGGFFPQTEITVPLRLMPRLYPDAGGGEPLLTTERTFWVRVMARFTGGAGRDQAIERWSAALWGQIAPMVTGNTTPARVVLLDGRRGLDQTRPETRRLLYILMGVVAVVLLLACVNLASLMLARGAARLRELHLRRALGASRWRLIRAQLIEGALLAFAGCAGGLLLTFWSRAAMTTLLTSGLGTAPLSRQPLEVSVDGVLMAGTLALSVLVTVVFSLLPALRLSRATTHDLKHQVTGAETPKLTLGRVMVAVQVAITLPLLVGAVLFLRTMANLTAVDLGFDPAGIAYFKINPATVAPTPEGQALVYQQVVEAVRRVPGVRAATLVENALLSGITSNTGIEIDGRRVSLYINAVGPDYLDTIGVRLLAGRVPGHQDGPGRPRVAAINETGARALFGDGPALGRVIPFSSYSIEVVGIVADTLYDQPRAPVRPTLFPSALQRPGYNGHHVVVRSGVPAASLEPLLRDAVAGVSRDLPVPEIKTQLAQVRDLTMRERVLTQVLTAFGAFAVLLACIGLNGVTAYAVARRTSEIGVRMALGATPGAVRWMILRQVGRLTIAGLVVGLPLAWWTGPLFGSLLFQVSPTDPRVFAAAAVALMAVALAAAWWPARRAARLDPLRALRSE